MWSPSFRVLLVGLLVAKLLHNRDATTQISCNLILEHDGQRSGRLTPCHLCEQVKATEIDEVAKITYAFLEPRPCKSSALRSEVSIGERIEMMNTVPIIPGKQQRGEERENHRYFA
ncbi:hypothetical protein KP509_05G077200 [Ceratopteris richardii]|uniref:Secreted protein n=1 Tax=Ceratopteris richardii TaxID=49495 RepID=A0A8T2USD3_CERRI|nr:hypothetical protein KP509_05G077200 [Ceratopteris richardii]